MYRNMRKSKIGILFIVITMVILSFFPQEAAWGEQAKYQHNMSEFINAGALYMDNGGDTPSEEIKDGADVSVHDKLMLKYDFSLSVNNIEDISASGNDRKYEITCPDGLKWVGKSSTDIYLNSGDSNVKYAVMTVIDEHEAYIQFVDDLENTVADGVDDGYFYLSCALDADALGIPKGDVVKEIELTKDTVLEVNIEENKAKSSALTEKTGEYDSGKFTWTVKYVPGNKEENLPLVFSDTFVNKYHDYVDGSFKVSVGSGEAKAAEVQSKEADGKRTIVYEIPENTEEPLTFYYETELTNAGFSVGEKKEVENTARLFNSKRQQVGKDVAASVSFNPVEWIAKKGEVIGSGMDRAIKWTVTVNTNSKNLSRLVLKDKLPNQDGYKYLSFDKDSFQVCEFPGGAKISNDRYNVTFAENMKGFELEFLDTGNSSAGKLADKYVVTYKTKIAKDYFYEGANYNINNAAELEYAWPDGEGEYSPQEPPSVESEVGVDGRILQKTAEGYNPANHQITWKVTVNPFGLNLKNIAVTDNLKDVGQTYVSGSFKSAPENGNINATFTSDNKTINLKIYDLGTDTYTFTFNTTVDNYEHYALNHDGTYKNTANAAATIIKDGSSEEKAIESQDTAKQRVISNVLKKESGGYDYSTQEITWKITLNENGMPMDNVVFSDELKEGLSYVKDTLEVRNAEGKEITPYSIAYDEGSRKLTVSFTELKEKAFITFKTKVNPDDIDDFKTEKEIAIKNEAELKFKTGDHEPSQTSEAKQLVDNVMLQKNGTYDHGMGCINYIVNINPNLLDIGNANITDKLSEGLQLDRDTVKLYKADISDDGKGFRIAEEISLQDRITVDMMSRSFTINLPDEKARYILKYSADVTDPDKAPFTNKISMTGTVEADNGENGTETNIIGGGGGGTTSPKVNLTIIKKDETRSDKLIQGVKFIIYDGDDPINVAVTDKNGQARFAYLKRGKTYKIVETKTPKGYCPLDKPVEIYIGDNTEQYPREYAVTIKNKPVTGEISFKKENNFGRELAGAEFTIEDTGSDYSKKAVSDDEGIVTFKDVPFGTYDVKETKVPEHYSQSEEDVVYKAVISADGGTVGLLNEDGTPLDDNKVINFIEGSKLVINMVDGDTGKPMAGVTFKIYDSKGTVCGEGKTDENGVLVFDDLMPFEDYKIVEYTPEGYKDENSVRIVKNLPLDGTTLKLENYSKAENTGESLKAESDSTENKRTKTDAIAKTGDNTNIMSVMILAVTMAVCIAAMVFILKTKRGYRKK